jgi:hypothetical protein
MVDRRWPPRSTNYTLPFELRETFMTADGGMNPDVETWDEARIALGRVADLIREKLGSYGKPGSYETVSLEELRAVENYHLIPEGVRETLENLSPDELRVVKKVFESLAENHFYLEGGPGGLRFY